ncbi:hypothetical protein SELMODRAFT_416024 [Selaginella moellendorffii]|uniref:Uncharacterized protein n=1 Tax=Selaginella moellendorffii TaxID=88036 RepID=D8RXU2_SELML|nr:hypothetical protein SELMODRAFT_416024 [Selaginella moellendorffii]
MAGDIATEVGDETTEPLESETDQASTESAVKDVFTTLSFSQEVEKIPEEVAKFPLEYHRSQQRQHPSWQKLQLCLNTLAFLHFCALVKESSVLSDSNKHQVVPREFIGIIKRQQSVILRNIFAYGKVSKESLVFFHIPEEPRAEGVLDYLIPHRTFTGNRPSLSALYYRSRLQMIKSRF